MTGGFANEEVIRDGAQNGIGNGLGIGNLQMQTRDQVKDEL